MLSNPARGNQEYTRIAGFAGIARIICAAMLLQGGPVLAHPGAEDQLAYLTQRIEAEPDNQSLLIQRGAVYSIEGRFEAALSDLRQAETLGNPLAVAYQLGVLYYRKGDFASARQYFDITLKADPHHAQSLEYRARVLRDAGEHEAAIEDLTLFFALTPNPNPGHFLSAARMLGESGGGESQFSEQGIAAAIEMLDRGMNQLGLTPQLQHYAIELELQRNNPAAAIARQESLEPMLGASPDWQVRMGELQLAAGNENEASAYFEAAVRQLEKLRQTPARQRLAGRAAAQIR
jgi:tetratricopeptide (TPR) repeat protein